MRKRHGGSHVGVWAIERVRRLVLICRRSRQGLNVSRVMRRERFSTRKAMPRRREERSHEGRLSGVQTRSG